MEGSGTLSQGQQTEDDRDFLVDADETLRLSAENAQTEREGVKRRRLQSLGGRKRFDYDAILRGVEGDML